MFDYSRYYPALIAITEAGNAFIYWVDNSLIALTELNYGRGKNHWFEYLGKQTPIECREKYPITPILQAQDPRISTHKKGKIREMEELIL
jgi:hypothetical protein